MQQSQEIKNIVDSIVKAVDVEKIYLFGSRAYGTPHADSDYDFYLVLPDNGIKPLEAMVEANVALSAPEFMFPIDIVADYSKHFYERKDHYSFEEKVFNKGVVLYEQA